MTSDGFPTLGILGGGQLGRMMALAAIRLGIPVRFLSPKPSGPMQGLGEQMVGDWTDPDVLRAFAEGCHAITVESEWAPAEHLADVLPETSALWPSPETLRLIRHKGIQNRMLRAAGLPLPRFRCCATLEEAKEAAADFGFPAMMKRYEGSYDGYGNATLRTRADLEPAWNDLATDDGVLVEAWAPFVRELSVLVCRRADGVHVEYPVVYTEQKDHRCHAVVAPAPHLSSDVEAEARRVALAAVEAVGGVGITGVELFEMEDGRVLVNELAPRPHNTGHYTIDACHTSQFENHVRAVLGLPLGDPGLRVPCAVMVNVLGQRKGTAQPQGLAEALDIAGASVHLYGKPTVRPKRKMGHVTVTGNDPEDVRARAEKAAARIHL